MNDSANSLRFLKETASIECWLDQCRAQAKFSCEKIHFKEVNGWIADSWKCRHQSGGFFSLIAIEADINEKLVQQPIILQPEVGILGFLLRCWQGEMELLFQAKTEPGNVGVVQLAPAVQATKSNYLRLHGGHHTPFLNFFLNAKKSGARVLVDCLQSEQGGRFLGKFNRNMVVYVEAEGPAITEKNWRWIPLRLLPDLMAKDFLVNTDARSVLSCMGHKNIDVSAHAGNEPIDTESRQSVLSALEKLSRYRSRSSFEVKRLPLEGLHNWRWDSAGFTDNARQHFDIAWWRTCAADREVAQWDQPLVQSLQEGRCVLLCQRQGGRLKFLLRALVEIGFFDYAQYAPSLQYCPALSIVDDAQDALLRRVAATGKVLVSCLQSDEGGRFYKSVSRYEIIEIESSIHLRETENSCWLSLAEITLLLKQKGIMNNELRSCLALQFAMNASGKITQ